MTPDKLLEIALDHSPADQTEASICVSKSALTRFANSAIHQNMLFEDTVIKIRAAFGKKVASGSANNLDESGLIELVDRVVETARLQDENPDFVSLPQPVYDVHDVKACCSSTVVSSPEQRAESVRALVAESDKINGSAAGSFMVRSADYCVKNTLGVDSRERSSYANLLTVVTGPDGGFGYAASTSNNVADIDGQQIGEQASKLARDTANPITLEPGDYECILMPYAVSDMINMLVWMGFRAFDYQEGRSWVCGKLGQKVVSDSICLWDDGLDSRTVVSSIDNEGIAKQRVDLIKNGVANAVLYDSYTAHRENKQSTGHAPRGCASNLILAPGRSSVDEMIASTKRGVLVTRFHYTNIAHQMSASFTGMTRDGMFFIENGKITAPVKNMRFTQSITKALLETQMIGSELKLEEGVLAPAIKLGNFSFSSTTQY